MGLVFNLNGTRAEPTNFPTEARDLFEKGQALQQKGRLQEAIAAYEEAIKQGMGGFPRVHLYRAGSFLGLGEYDQAIAQYTRFLRDFTLEDSCRH
jgi:tetratricopeptide (TPR) repeat protein